MGKADGSSGADLTEQSGTRPKRSHGEGNIYKRADGVYVGRIMLGRKPNGQPDRPRVTGATRAAVLKQIAELRRQANEGTLADSAQGRQTLGAYLDAWLDAAGTTARPQTLIGYRQIVRDHITPSIG